MGWKPVGKWDRYTVGGLNDWEEGGRGGGGLVWTGWLRGSTSEGNDEDGSPGRSSAWKVEDVAGVGGCLDRKMVPLTINGSKRIK